VSQTTRNLAAGFLLRAFDEIRLLIIDHDIRFEAAAKISDSSRLARRQDAAAVEFGQLNAMWPTRRRPRDSPSPAFVGRGTL